jgi:hypothetical protein
MKEKTTTPQTGNQVNGTAALRDIFFEVKSKGFPFFQT